MFELIRDFAFARVRLAIECINQPVLSGDAVLVSPELPQGMRVDRCLLDSVEFQVESGEELSIYLKTILKSGWAADWESGEALDTILFSHTSGDVAAVGMRDPDWICDRYGLVCLSATQTKPSTTDVIATYTAKAPLMLSIQATCAWTKNPKTNHEADSPWFAVDKALQF